MRSCGACSGTATSRPPSISTAAWRRRRRAKPSLECRLEQVLAILLAAGQHDGGTQQVPALDGEQFLEHIDRLFAVHQAPLIAVTHQVRAARARGCPEQLLLKKQP